jgi:hypothetical protein
LKHLHTSLCSFFSLNTQILFVVSLSTTLLRI